MRKGKTFQSRKQSRRKLGENKKTIIIIYRKNKTRLAEVIKEMNIILYKVNNQRSNKSNRIKEKERTNMNKITRIPKKYPRTNTKTTENHSINIIIANKSIPTTKEEE